MTKDLKTQSAQEEIHIQDSQQPYSLVKWKLKLQRDTATYLTEWISFCGGGATTILI